MDFQKTVKRLTINFVTYTNLSADEKNEKKLGKQKENADSLIYSNKWFGIIPFAWRFVNKSK